MRFRGPRPTSRRTSRMHPDVTARLALARDLASRWLPPRRRGERSASLGIVLVVAQLAGIEDADAIAEIEIAFHVSELLRRGRREDGQRVVTDDLVAVGLR